MSMTKKAASLERIPRRPPPEFRESEESIISGVMEDGFLNVALNDANQFGPHAMIMLLFAVASVTAIALLLPTLF
ncbi:MAG: hypothetical protein CMA88_03480 [Euryarchaeota archaeon]|nr:hypothetical protein [Euryarchaeota archaeon]|tara:strand:+ start:1780 stop:2004 length:225 start_codon:yes stop_codon:yes gene_type:complete